MSRRCLGAAILLCAAGLLALTQSLSHLPAPPLYDGLSLPPEPYRYLQPPAGFHSKAPTSAQDSFPVSGRESPDMFVSTTESPAQARLILDPGAVHLPPSVTQVKLAIRPVLPESEPEDGTIEGNIYRITLTANTGAGLSLKKKAHIQLRGTNPPGFPVIEQYTGGHWIRLQTGKFIGVVIYSADASSLGDFALVRPGAVSHKSGVSFLPYLIIGGIVIVLVAVLLLLVRLSRRDAALAEEDAGEA